MQRAALIVGAWGGKSFRGWVLSGEGEVLASRETDLGLSAVKDRDFATALGHNCQDWLDSTLPLPVVLSGMVGARTGWVETPYAPCPLDADALVAVAARVDCLGTQVHILPGASHTDSHGDFDVMRGEELQLMGVAAMCGGRDVDVCIPGTHSKLASLRSGKLVSFRTFVTGELYGLVSGQSLIAGFAEGDAFDQEAFRAGVIRGAREPLSHALFPARANVLNGTLSAQSVRAYISGTLIGAELAAHPAGNGVPAVLLASGASADRYRIAFAALSRSCEEIDARKAALAGFQTVGRALLGRV